MKHFNGLKFDETNNTVYFMNDGEAFKGAYNQCVYFINHFGKGNKTIDYRADLDVIKHHDPGYRNIMSLYLKANKALYKKYLDRCEFLGDVTESIYNFARDNYPDTFNLACESVSYTYADAKKFLDRNISEFFTRQGMAALYTPTAQEQAGRELFEEVL